MWNPMFQEVKIMGTGAPYVGQAVRYPGLRGPAISQAPAAAPAVPPPPSSPDDFVGPCPDGTTQTATGCVPNTPSGAPAAASAAAAPAAPSAPVAPKAPAAPKAGIKTSTYIAGGIAVAALLAAVLIPK